MTVASRPKRIWITRSAPYCDSSASLLRRYGFKVLAVPVLRIRPIAVSHPRNAPDALAFTSAHGVLNHPNDPAWRHLPVYTAGNHSAEAARAAGYSNVYSTEGDLDALKALIARTLPGPARLFVFGARESAVDLAGFLRQGGYEAEQFIVYEAHPSSGPELGEAIDALQRIDGICVYSPRAAERIAEEFQTRSWRGTVFCISEACARPFPIQDHVLVEVATRPDEQALRDLVRWRWSDAIGRAARPPSLALRDFRILVRPGNTANDNRRDIPPAGEPDGDDPPPTAA